MLGSLTGSAPPTAAKFLAWLRNNKAGNSAVVVEKRRVDLVIGSWEGFVWQFLPTWGHFMFFVRLNMN